MNALKYITLGLLIIVSLVIFVFAVKSGKTFKALFLNSFSGGAALALINLTTVFTGVSIPLNLFTALGSLLYGIPSVCGFLILPLIFK